MNTSYKYCVDEVEFELAEETDISFISDYGRLLKVFDKNDSGNISFIVESDQKYFLKVAGLKTCCSELTKSIAIKNLRRARDIYKAIKHRDVVQPIEYQETGRVAVLAFPYVEGECLFDHWNFDFYKKNKIIPPLQRFLLLSKKTKMRFVESLFEFYKYVNNSGYIATDFYEGSIIYDFANCKYHFCDLDFFTEIPSVNTTGFQWGPNRFLAPEEKIAGHLIDVRTDVYHLGVFIRTIFSDYETNQWQLSDEKFNTIQRALSLDASDRFSSVEEFERLWGEAL